MAASSTLPQQPVNRKSPISKTGVLILNGFGIKVRMQSGHLEIEDGIGPERRRIRLARVGHGLKRLVVIGSDGFVSLAALRWLADQDASFALFERDGSTLVTTGPVHPSEAKLRRAQALAHTSGAALKITRELISRKLDGQERVARDKLLDTFTADTIARFRSELPLADSINSIRLIELKRHVRTGQHGGHCPSISRRATEAEFPIIGVTSEHEYHRSRGLLALRQIRRMQF